jgi:hypothetical protein
VGAVFVYKGTAVGVSRLETLRSSFDCPLCRLLFLCSRLSLDTWTCAAAAAAAQGAKLTSPTLNLPEGGKAARGQAYMHVCRKVHSDSVDWSQRGDLCDTVRDTSPTIGKPFAVVLQLVFC